MKKGIIMAASILIVLSVIYFIGSGFTKNGSVSIEEYSISADGKEITMNIGVASSAGHIRKLDVYQQEGGKLYIDCYSAFGGFNGSIGAKDIYTLPLDENTTMIAIYRNTNAYEEVLRKDIAGKWQRVK